MRGRSDCSLHPAWGDRSVPRAVAPGCGCTRQGPHVSLTPSVWPEGRPPGSPGPQGALGARLLSWGPAGSFVWWELQGTPVWGWGLLSLEHAVSQSRPRVQSPLGTSHTHAVNSSPTRRAWFSSLTAILRNTLGTGHLSPEKLMEDGPRPEPLPRAPPVAWGLRGETPRPTGGD